jgi:hypothetical protein
MTRSLARIALRYLRRHPWQLTLAVLGIALGVAVAVSIDLANESARRAFALATEAVTGRATHQIVGGPSGLPDALYRALRVDLGARAAAPVLTGDVAAIDFPGRAFTVLGVDPFAEAPFRPYLDPADGSSQANGRRAADKHVAPGASQRREPAARDPLGAVAELITRPGAVLVARPTARDLALAVGDRLNVRVAGMPRALTVIGILEPAEPLLILPEVKDPKRWFGGHVWLDNAKQYIYAFQVYQSENIWHNASMMKPEEARSYDDLLLPKFKGKIGILDPRSAGAGTATWAFFLKTKPFERFGRSMVAWINIGFKTIEIQCFKSVA